jgi:valyl-tRNA synthetase
MSRYEATQIEAKWQAAWDDANVFQATRDEANQNTMCWKCSPTRLGASTWGMYAIIPWAM